MPGLKLPPRIWNKRCLVKNYLNETGHFHKYSPNYRSAYVTLQNFTPGLQKNYTDISAISVTFRNSGGMVPNSAPPPKEIQIFEHKHDQKSHNTKFPLCHCAGVFNSDLPPPKEWSQILPPHGNPNFEHKNDQKNHNTKSPLCHYAGMFIFENF